MQSDIDVDLEELESRLYSQVFHSNQVYEQEQTNLVPNNTDSTNRHISTYTISNISNSKRYFGGKQVAEAPQQQKAHPKSTIITLLETIDCRGNREQNATDINKQSLNDATSAISKKQKKKMRKAKQRAANKKLTNDTVINPVNQARNGHSYNLRSANNQQPIDPWQLFIPTDDKPFSDLRIQGHEACYGLPLVKNASQLILSNQLIEMVHNQQFYDVRQSANQASHVQQTTTTTHVPPLMGMVDGQQIFNIQSANQAGHIPPLMGLVVNRPANQSHPPPLMGIVGNQQFGDSIKTGNQSEHVSPSIVNLVDDQQFDSESHEPPTKNVSFYDSKWASIKMPISKQDFGLPDLSCANQVTPASGPSVVNETMPAHCITNQNVAVNSEKLIFQNLNLPQQSPTFATISSKCNPISQFESDIKYLNDYITNLNDIVDLYPDGPQSEANDKTNDEIIILSDSEDSVILLPSPAPVVYSVDDSSDELDSTNLELEHLDPDPSVATATQRSFAMQNISSPEIQTVCLSPETKQQSYDASPEICKTINLETLVKPTEMSHKVNEITEIERTELLFTPDSNTNDFIENDVDILNNRGSGFNFNLHGSDLDLNKLEKPPSHVARPDVYETESSCSEAGTITKIFTEVDFVLPTKEIFCEPDLASFSKFITPTRNEIAPDLVLNLECTSVKSKAFKKTQHSQHSENDNLLSDNEYNSDATSLMIKKKSKNKKKKDKRKQLEDEASKIFQNIGDSFNSETEVVQQNKKDKRKKSDEETNEIMYNANENVTLKKTNTRKKSNDEACEQAEIISHNPFNNEIGNPQKKKNKRKKIDKEICEQTDELQDLKKSENTQVKKKDKRKKLDDVEICEQIDSPTGSNNDTDIVTKRKKEKRKNVDAETSGLFESSTHLNNATEIATQKKKEKRKKVDEKTGEQTESLISSNMETKIVTQKKKEKRKKLDEETCEQIDPPNSNNETEIVIQKKKNKRKKQEDEANSEPSYDIVDSYQQNTIEKVQIKKKNKRKKFDDKVCLQIETIVTNHNPIENETVHTQKKENRKIFDDRATRKRIEFIVNNSLSSETQNAPQKKKDKRKKMEDETTSEQIENKIKTSQIESVIENPSQESKPIAEHRHEIGSIKIECDTAMKNLEDNVVQPNNKVNFSFMSAWNQIPPSTFQYSKETIGNDQESTVKNLNETLTLPDSPQIANTFDSKPIIDDLEILTTTLQILKKPYHSPKVSETKVSESLKLLSPKVSEVNTKIVSDSLKDSIPTSKKSQIPINIDLKGSAAEQRHEIDSIKIECDTAMKSMDENVVQPNNKVNFSFMSAWNQIQPSTFQYSKETIGNAQESIVKNLNETLTLSDSPQIANTFDSKPIEDDLEILTTTPQILKDSYHSPKDSETKVSDSLKLLSPKVSEVNTKIVSDCLKDSNPTSKKSQIPINIELEGSAGSGNSKESSKILIKGFQQISKVVKDNVLENSIDALESKTKKSTEILEDFSHQITLPNPISKEAPKISKTPELITKKIPSQTSQQCDTTEMPKALDSRSKRILSQASKEIPQTSRQSPPIAEVSQIPKTPDNKTKKHLSHASKEVPQTLTKPSLISEIPLALKSKIQTFIFQTFKESTQTANPKTLNLPHSSKKSPPIIDISEVDYIPISLQTDGKMNPKQASIKMSTNILLNISPPKQSTSKVSDKKLVANPFSFTDSDRKTFSDFWTDDMKKFYEESWGQENYDIDMVLKSMPSDESKWKIIVEDKFRSRSPRTRGPACQKCREVGHSKYHCTRYPGPLKCAICGASGHFHARCPNLMCTSCGNQGGYFTTSCSKCAHYKKIICSLCNSIGHHNTKCPDLWRRYHLTTEDLPTLNSTISKLKPNNKRWCSNCARRGHLQNVCTYMNTEHFTTMPHIISYDPCYNRIFNISPAAQPENIPTMFENTNLSQIRDYKNKMFEFNKERYLHLLKILKRQCRSSDLPYIPDIEKMERALQRDQNPKHIIGNIYKLRSLIQKGNMWK